MAIMEAELVGGVTFPKLATRVQKEAEPWIVPIFLIGQSKTAPHPLCTFDHVYPSQLELSSLISTSPIPSPFRHPLFLPLLFPSSSIH